MKLLQVKEYNQTVARSRKEKAMKYWREKADGYGYPVDSMFYFMLSDSRGYPTVKRKNGWVAFNKSVSYWGKNAKKAKERYLRQN